MYNWFLFQHEAPIKAVRWIKATSYSCLMTGSWDKTLKVGTNLIVIFKFTFYFYKCYSHSTVYWYVESDVLCTGEGSCTTMSLFYLSLQFWDTRTPSPMATIQLPERVYCADVVSRLK